MIGMRFVFYATRVSTTLISIPVNEQDEHPYLTAALSRNA